MLLRLVREHDVLLESFRPGVLDRLGVGYERLREENPRLVYCAITGHGQDGPDRDRPGHDMNYLARGGLLGLSGERGGPPVPAAGQIADIGGGALMAAFAILAALHERERSGEGQLVDVSMTRGAQSWLAMVAARYFADGEVPSRGELELAGGLPCYRPYACADGWVTLGALEPKFWLGFCARPRPRRPAPTASSTRGSRPSSRRSSPPARAPSGRRSTTSTTAAWSRCSISTRRSPARRTRSSRSTSRARPRRSGCSARPSGSRARPPTARGPGRTRRRHRRGARRARLRRRRDRGAEGGRRGRRRRRRARGELPGMTSNGPG